MLHKFLNNTKDKIKVIKLKLICINMNTIAQKNVTSDTFVYTLQQNYQFCVRTKNQSGINLGTFWGNKEQVNVSVTPSVS